MGYTIYFRTEISLWHELGKFLQEVCSSLGFDVEIRREEITINPGFPKVEPLIIRRRGACSVKTYRLEPYTSLYRLILYSLSSFGSVEISEDL